MSYVYKTFYILTMYMLYVFENLFKQEGRVVALVAAVSVFFPSRDGVTTTQSQFNLTVYMTFCFEIILNWSLQHQRVRSNAVVGRWKVMRPRCEVYPRNLKLVISR